MTAIIFGTLSALIWGACDFAGGIASRRTGPYRAVFYGETFGLLLLCITTTFFHERPISWDELVLSITAGICGGFGALILYTAMGRGQMSIAAPVSALFAAILPVAVGVAMEGLPSPVKLTGFVVALFAIWMVAQNKGQKSQRSRLSNLQMPLISGLCFGVYFILLHQATHETMLWPLIISRFTGMLLVIVFMLAHGQSWQVSRSIWPFIIVNGALDIGGNVFYILAGQNGRLDVAAVLSSLYPGITVLLAWLILKEEISNLQKFGIFTALIAIILMTL